MYLLICNDVNYDIKVLHFVEKKKKKKCKYLEKKLEFFLEIKSKLNFVTSGHYHDKKIFLGW